MQLVHLSQREVFSEAELAVPNVETDIYISVPGQVVFPAVMLYR